MLTPVRSRAGILGLFVNNAARSKGALEESRQMQLAVFAAIVGNLLEAST